MSNTNMEAAIHTEIAMAVAITKEVDHAQWPAISGEVIHADTSLLNAAEGKKIVILV